jgi:hypothetical protein
LPVNFDDECDRELINNLKIKLKKFLKTVSKNVAYKGKRINELGNNIESQLVYILNNEPFKARLLGKKGYPDIEIYYKNSISYLEIKTSNTIQESSYRYFYYTKGTKVTTNAHHILLSILAVKDVEGLWSLKEFVLSDLYNLNVSLKAEFNASKTDLIDKKSILLKLSIDS